MRRFALQGRWLRVALLVAVIAGLTGTATLTAQDSPQTIRILHNNDWESALEAEGDGLGGAARIAGFVQRTRAETDRMLFLSGGDNILAGDFFNFFLGEASFKAMSAAGYDAAGLGNHEFDRGEQVLADAISNFADFPYLSSNLTLGDESPLKPLMQPFTSTTTDALRAGEHGGLVYDGLLVDHNGLNVCLFGLLDPEIQNARLTQLGPNTEITDPVAAAERMKALCDDNGADLVVGMIHLAAALRIDTQIKQAVPGIDLFVNGGTDAVFDPVANPGDNVVETSEGPSLSVQGPGDGNRIGRLDLTMEGGRVTDFDYVSLPVVDDLATLDEEDRAEIEAAFPDFPFAESFAPDADVQALVDEFAVQVEELLSQPVGTTRVTLDGKTETNRQRETNIGNYITDCFIRNFDQADFAIHNGGGIRSDQPPGELTFRDVQSITPFGNTIVLLDLTGAQVREMLENSVSNVEGTQGRYLQISEALRYAYDLTQPIGERVIEGSVTIGGEPLDEGAVYKVASLNFLAAGGDGYAVFTRAQNALDTTFPQDSALSQCIETDGAIDPTIEGRVLSKIGWLRFGTTEANLGQSVTARGIVTLAPGEAGLDAQTFYVQDSANGIRVSLSAAPEAELAAGSFVSVTGTLAEVAGQFELQGATVEAVTSLDEEQEGLRFNVQPHEPISIRLANLTDSLEFLEGSLVRVQEVAEPGDGVVAASDLSAGDGTVIGVVEQQGDAYRLRVTR